MDSKLYYECHVTVEPIPAERQELFGIICKTQKFWSSDWALKTETFKFFATSRGTNYEELKYRMERLIAKLKRCDYKIARYKIEDTVIDSKIDDHLNLLDPVSSGEVECPVLGGFEVCCAHPELHTRH